MRHVFVTGSSGFLGRHLLRELLRATDDRFYLLTRSERSLVSIRRHLGCLADNRIVFIPGDITQPCLGIHEGIRQMLSCKIDEVWHLAASTSFDERDRAGIAHANVQGTGHLVETVRSFRNLTCLFHVSTAYACGMASGIVPEIHFAPPKAFRNVYEETKNAAERLVLDSGLPHAIIRPSILVGDSRTGRASGEIRMVYGYLLALYLAAARQLGGTEQFWKHWCNGNGREFAAIDARLLVAGDALKNLVTIDDMVVVCMAIRRAHITDQAKIYHVVNPRYLKLGDMIDAGQSALHIQGFRYDSSLGPQSLAAGNLAERLAFRNTRPFIPYTTESDPRWAAENVRRLGVDRVAMTNELFEFLMRQYVAQELRPHA